MPTTPVYELRYPDGSDSPNGPLQIQNLAQDVEDTLGAAFTMWTTWTPTWTASNTNPVIGNGAITGSYTRVGSTVHFSATILLGSTTTVGVGDYSVSLPLAAASGPDYLCHAYFHDADGATAADQHYIGGGVITSGASAIGAIHLAGVLNGLPWSATAPVVPDEGDYLTISGTYETSA
jgi:hypothetical protein